MVQPLDFGPGQLSCLELAPNPGNRAYPPRAHSIPRALRMRNRSLLDQLNNGGIAC